MATSGRTLCWQPTPHLRWRQIGFSGVLEQKFVCTTVGESSIAEWHAVPIVSAQADVDADAEQRPECSSSPQGGGWQLQPRKG